MIIALGLLLKVATIILDCILSLIFGNFRACGSIRVPTPPIVALTEFFPCIYRDKCQPIAGIVISNIFSMNVSVFLYAYYVYVMIYCRSCQLGSWPILFTVLTLNFGISIVRLHFSNFCFSLSSGRILPNTGARAPTLVGRAPFLSARKAMLYGQVIIVRVMVIFRWLCFYSHL